MRVSTSWIKSALGRTILDTEIVSALELAGIEVEQYSCSNALDDNIIVAKVQNVRQHPEADRLHIVTVATGKEEFEVVCGAPNVRPGILVPFAMVGAILPSGDTILKAKLRGVVSNGMLCSGRELGLSDDHEGLLELGVENEVGLSLSRLYPADGHLDLKTQANRFDLLSVLGLTREVAGQLDFVANTYIKSELLYSSKSNFIASADTSVARIQFAEITVDPSLVTPDWMIQRLSSAGVRSLGIIVDITNYVMLEYGQPLHAYDADQVSLPFSVRFADKDEKLTTLDNIERKLSADDLMVADTKSALGLAGVMGGAKSEVSKDTKRIYLEAASFDGGQVRKMAKRHGLRSEASARFERGLPVQLQPAALAYAIKLLEEHAGGTFVAAEDKLNVYPYEYRIGMRSSYASKMLGIELSREEIVVTLARLGIEARPFDIVTEAKSHQDKPYKWGANFREDRTDAFDCSYLTDYIYSLVGKRVGHTAAQQFAAGSEIALDELQRGDLLFRGGPWKKLKSSERGGVSHVAMYVGGGKIVEASDYVRIKGDWVERDKNDRKVVVSDLESITADEAFLGARRYIESPDDWISIDCAPWWRPDLRLEEDLLEELARTIGYDKIPATIPAWHPQTVDFDRVRRPKQRLRDLLSGLGLYEVMTYSFVSADQIEGIGEEVADYLKLQNPLSNEQAYLRRSLLPSHLHVLEQNRKDFKEIAFYEISGVFHPTLKGKLPDEPEILAVTTATAGEGYRYVKGIWDRIAEQLQLEYQLIGVDEKPFATGRRAQIMLKGKEVGQIGVLLPSISRNHKISGEIGYFEVDLSAIIEAGKDVSFEESSKYPAANRDITVLAPVAAQWQKIDKALNAISGIKAMYGGDYYSDEIPPGFRSLTIHLAFSSTDHTLSDDEVKTHLVKVDQLLQNKFKIKSKAS